MYSNWEHFFPRLPFQSASTQRRRIFFCYLYHFHKHFKEILKVHKNVEVPFYFKLWWMQNLKKVQGCVINIYPLPLVLCSYGKYGMIPYCTALALHLRVTVFTYILTQLRRKDCWLLILGLKTNLISESNKEFSISN